MAEVEAGEQNCSAHAENYFEAVAAQKRGPEAAARSCGKQVVAWSVLVQGGSLLSVRQPQPMMWVIPAEKSFHIEAHSVQSGYPISQMPLQNSAACTIVFEALEHRIAHDSHGDQWFLSQICQCRSILN